MKNGLSHNEKAFFLRLKGHTSKGVKIIPIAILAFVILGLIIDALFGFHFLRMVKSLFSS